MTDTAISRNIGPLFSIFFSFFAQSLSKRTAIEGKFANRAVVAFAMLRIGSKTEREEKKEKTKKERIKRYYISGINGVILYSSSSCP